MFFCCWLFLFLCHNFSLFTRVPCRGRLVRTEWVPKGLIQLWCLPQFLLNLLVHRTSAVYHLSLKGTREWASRTTFPARKQIFVASFCILQNFALHIVFAFPQKFRLTACFFWGPPTLFSRVNVPYRGRLVNLTRFTKGFNPTLVFLLVFFKPFGTASRTTSP